MKSHVQGKVALILGATNEVGAAIARRLASAGMRLALLDRSAWRLRELAESIQAQGTAVSRAPVDVANPTSIAVSVAKALHPYGRRIDVLVNNIGGCPTIPQEAALLQRFLRCGKTFLRLPFSGICTPL